MLVIEFYAAVPFFMVTHSCMPQVLDTAGFPHLLQNVEFMNVFGFD